MPDTRHIVAALTIVIGIFGIYVVAMLVKAVTQ